MTEKESDCNQVYVSSVNCTLQVRVKACLKSSELVDKKRISFIELSISICALNTLLRVQFLNVITG